MDRVRADNVAQAVDRSPISHPMNSRWRVSTLLWLASAGGILAGAVEVGLLIAQHGIADRIVFLGRHAWWMKPLANAILFVVIVGLAALAWRLSGRGTLSLRHAATLVATLAAFGLSMLAPQLHLAARAILALGLGSVAGRLAERTLRSQERAVGRAAAVLSLVTLVSAGFGARGAFSSPTGRSVAVMGQGPNVLLLVLDTVRARELSLYGFPRPTTPELERIARDGVTFRRAIATAPWTLPSHASMFTGHAPQDLSVSWRRPLDTTFPTLAGTLAGEGYRTAGFVANMSYCSWETGLGRGFQHYEDHPLSWRQFLVESALIRWFLGSRLVHWLRPIDQNFVRKSASDINRRFLRWLESSDSGRPFFAFLNYYDAHGPYQPPEPFRSAFAVGVPRGDVSPLHRWNANPIGPPPDSSIIAKEEAAYAASIASIDERIGALVDELERRGLLDETILIVTSDHGEEFGEHGVYDHGNSLYLDGLHVPLLIRYPAALPRGVWVEEPVSLAALPATVAELIGISQHGFPGPSWLAKPLPAHAYSYVDRATGLPEWFPVSRGDMASLVSDRWHLIRDGDGSYELYDLVTDRWERTDLGTDSTQSGVRDSLRALLDRAVPRSRPVPDPRRGSGVAR